jgi:hypothetical protein
MALQGRRESVGTVECQIILEQVALSQTKKDSDNKSRNEKEGQ